MESYSVNKNRISRMGYPVFNRRNVIRTRGLRSAPVGSRPRSPGPREPSAPERCVLFDRGQVLESYSVNKNRISRMGYPVFNRRNVIRTRDLCVPNAALYQAEPCAVLLQPMYYSMIHKISSRDTGPTQTWHRSQNSCNTPRHSHNIPDSFLLSGVRCHPSSIPGSGC